MEISEALSFIREIPDYPIVGVRFQDITPLLAHGTAFATVTEKFSSYGSSTTVIAGIEARGFIFASAVANQLKTGFVPIRKAGKLPYQRIAEPYGLEYGSGTLEIHIDAVDPGSKILLIDDVLATGGTISAAIKLLHQVGGQVIHVLALLEIADLPGRAHLTAKYPQIPITSLIVC